MFYSTIKSLTRDYYSVNNNRSAGRVNHASRIDFESDSSNCSVYFKSTSRSKVILILFTGTSRTPRGGRFSVNKSILLRYSLSVANYIITQVIFSFRLILAYDLSEVRRTLDVIITLSHRVLKWRKVLRIWQYFTWLGKREGTKTSRDWKEEKGGEKDKAVSLLEIWLTKYSSSLMQSEVERVLNSTKLVLVSWEPLLYLEFNKLKYLWDSFIEKIQLFSVSKLLLTRWLSQEWNIKTAACNPLK